MKLKIYVKYKIFKLVCTHFYVISIALDMCVYILFSNIVQNYFSKNKCIIIYEIHRLNMMSEYMHTTIFNRLISRCFYSENIKSMNTN